uniref:PHD-type domain-containing protein n=1 Tax=Anopheles atroparvus TaxID=41427 RepID=A0AAG5DFX4_ANOAO
MEKHEAVLPTVAEAQCARCERPDNDDMVACDDCNAWFHFECVGVDQTVESREWSCSTCRAKAEARPAGSSAMSDRGNPDSRQASEEVAALKEQVEQWRAIAKARERDAEIAKSHSAPEIMTRTTRLSSTAYPPADPFELSYSQMAARQAVRTELPTFSGDPEEWAMFKSCYDRSTRMCGFTDDENTLRLQQALRGKALKTVQCRLRHANNIDEVMRTLEKNFGRPDVLVNSLLQQVRNTPPPKPDRFDSLIEYGAAVEEICATVKSSCVAERMYDFTLLQELVYRLPFHIRLQWGQECGKLQKVTLEKFGEWMRGITDAAMRVCPPTNPERRPARPLYTQTESVNDTWGPDRRAEVNKTPTESVNDSWGPEWRAETNKEQVARHSCCVCARECATLEECDAFGGMTVAARWKVVRGQRLCKRCLQRHHGACHRTTSCGVRGCAVNHHTMLHNAYEAQPRPSGLYHQTATSDVLLRYVPVTLHGRV